MASCSSPNLPWYAGQFLKASRSSAAITEAHVADKPDLSKTLPLPTLLRRTAIVSFVRGEQRFHIVCVACSLRRVPDPDTGGEPIDWLHVHGYQGGPHASVNPSGN